MALASEKRVLKSLGLPNEKIGDLAMITIDGEGYYALEEMKAPSRPGYKDPRYRMKIHSRADRRMISHPLKEEPAAVQERIIGYGGKDVELFFLAPGAVRVPELDYWNNWNALAQGGLPHLQIYNSIVEEINRLVSEGARDVLLVGCGQGSFLRTLEARGCRALGIDPNEANVRAAKSLGRNVERGRIEDFKDRNFDVVIDPGVLSIGVVNQDYAREALPLLAGMVRYGGTLIHAPFTGSLINSDSLRELDLEIQNMSVPENLFTFDYPKQFYVAKKD